MHLDPGQDCLLLALLSLLNGSCKLMNLKCEYAPTAGSPVVALGVLLPAPAILGCTASLLHEISRGSSCSSML